MVKWSCDCIGFIDDYNQCWVIKACDSGCCDNEIGLHTRDMKEYNKGVESDKTFSPLSKEESDALWMEVSSLIRDGNHLRTIKRIITFSNAERARNHNA